MENANSNTMMKDMMANSGLEINNPQFNTIVINKIMQRKKQRFVFRYIFFCLLFIITITAVVLLLINRWQPQNTDIANRLDAFNRSIFPNAANAKSMAWQSIYLFLPLGTLLLLKKIIDLKFNR